LKMLLRCPITAAGRRSGGECDKREQGTGINRKPAPDP
jgi:hypothetical protein